MWQVTIIITITFINKKITPTKTIIIIITSITTIKEWKKKRDEKALDIAAMV